MNKQQALEALLVRCRTYEEGNREVAATAHEKVLEQLMENVRNLDVVVAMPPSARRTAKLRVMLEQVGAKALYLLVDEVEVVAGRSLDEWLADADANYGAPIGGGTVQDAIRAAPNVVVTSGPANPTAINGAMMREVYAKGVQDGRRGA